MEPGDGRTGAGGAPAAGGAGGAAGAGGIYGDPEKLDQCELGFQRSEEPSRRCPWIADGRCYETKDKACACVCPVNRISTCLSGFPGGGDAPIEVYCV